MKTRLRKPMAVLAGIALFASTATGVAVAATSAFPGDPTTLAWYSADETTVTANPDKSNVPLVFYNAAGAPITTGSITAKPFVAYAHADGALRAGDDHASLFAYTANPSLAQGAWSGAQLTAANEFPVTGAPGAVGSDPVVKGTAGSLSLKDYIDSFPNNSSATNFAGVYEIRLRTGSDAKGVGTSYSSAYIKVTDQTWTVTSSPVALVNTTTTSTVPTATRYGTAFNVTATVDAADDTVPTGTVQVLKGATVLASKTLTAATGGLGKATIAVPGTKLLPGKHALTLRYTGSGSLAPSSATAKTVTVNKALSTTTAKFVAAVIKKTRSPQLVVTVKAAGIPKPTGKITVKLASGKILKTVTLTAVKNGKITITLPRFTKAGSYRVIAVYAGSTTVNGSKSLFKTIKITN